MSSSDVAARHAVDHDRLREAFSRAITAIERANIDYALVGGLATVILARKRTSNDIDVLVEPENARRTLQVLAEVGFKTEETNPHWLFKAWADDLLVDVLFKMKGDIYLDEEMKRRRQVRSFKGISVRVAPPEDIIVIKALAHDEETPQHWYDALGIIAMHPDLDWDYLLRRAQKGPRRVLSLLHYATSLDLLVPKNALERLSATVFETEAPPNQSTQSGDVYLAEHLRSALAHDPEVSRLDIEVWVSNGRVALRGNVTSEERKRRIEELVQRVAPGLRIDDELTVRELNPPGHESLP
jgi:predicted nucleotidyltransferase